MSSSAKAGDLVGFNNSGIPRSSRGMTSVNFEFHKGDGVNITPSPVRMTIWNLARELLAEDAFFQRIFRIVKNAL